MSEKNNYSISNVTPIVTNRGTKELKIMFKVNYSATVIKMVSILMNNYRKYSRPTNRHMVEPNGDVFVCGDKLSYNVRTDSHNISTKCHMHGTSMGCKFKLGITDEFMHRTKQELDHCRCYCKPATQYDYDKWCYNDCIQHNRLLDDNAKIYKRLIM